MPLNSDFVRQLQATFAAEAQEHIQVISCNLLLLEQQTNALDAEPLLAEIFRAAHSMKGASRAVGAEQIGAIAHRLETIFGNIRSGELQPLPAHFDGLYAALDAIAVLVQTLGSDAPDRLDVTAMVARLDHFDSLESDPSAAPPTTEDPTPERALAEAVAAPAPLAGAATPAVTPSSGTVAAPRLAPPAAAALEDTVRIATGKLDAIMGQVGELQVVRLNAEQHQRQLRSMLEEAEHWETECRAIHPVWESAVFWGGDSRQAAASQGSGGTAAPHLLEYVTASEARLGAMVRQLRMLWRRLDADNRRASQIVADLDSNVRRTRMMPVATVLETYPRMVRDLARDLGKQVRLVVEGGDTEVDRSVLELVKDPLTHLLRNAIDHGIELPSARQAAGKPVEGTIRLSATQRGGSILIEIADDGAGIDVERVRASAIRRGLLRPDEAAGLSDPEALWLIFRSGMSTSTHLTDLSGRGVGLDVVHDHIERLRGFIDVESRMGQGTHFILHLPLTVATTLCLLAELGEQVFALPTSGVLRILRVHPGQIGHAEGREVILLDGRPLAVVHLADVLTLTEPTEAGDSHARGQVAIVLGTAEKRVAFLVDAVFDVQELVVKSLPRPFVRMRHIAGATILGSGDVVLVLNLADLLRAAAQMGSRTHAKIAATAAVAKTPVILVVDDSFTTRTLEKTILETAGYRVQVAADGLEAWTLLQREGSDVLVSDVMMPRMSGFELTAKVRSDPRFKDLPVILVTAQESREDRERGVEVGADAYILKSAFDQESLLNTIRRFI